MSEDKTTINETTIDGITVLFFDKPNIDFVEENSLGEKINHDNFFSFLAKEEKALHVRFYWRAEEKSSYTQHLKQLRISLQARGIRFESIETDKDVDITIINDMITILFDVDDSVTRPKKIILCSGDKDYSNILGLAKRRLGISTTVISGENHCAEILKEVLDKTIFIENIISDNKDLLLNSSD